MLKHQKIIKINNKFNTKKIIIKIFMIMVFSFIFIIFSLKKNFNAQEFGNTENKTRTNQEIELENDQPDESEEIILEIPRNFQATSDNLGNVILSWEKDSNNTELNINYYLSINNNDWQLIDNIFIDSQNNSISVSLNFIEYNLNLGETYNFKIKSQVDDKESESTENKSVTLKKTPDKPTNLTATINNFGGVILSFSRSDESEIVGYKVSINNILSETVINDIENSNQIVLSKDSYNFIMGNNYIFRLLAVNEVGDGELSDDSESVIPDIPPSAPININAVRSNKQIIFSWLQPINIGSNIIKYEYRYKNSKDNNFTGWLNNNLNNTVTLTNLINKENYIFEVRAVNTMLGNIASTERYNYDPYLKIKNNANLPNGRINKNYSIQFQSNKNINDNIIWSVEAGRLPSGLILNPSTGNINGTPSQTGIYRFKIKVQN
jgi:hypothetical protein